MSIDLLTIEPPLLPGALVLIDGRNADAQFLAAHLYRNWSTYRCENTEVSVFELQEKSLGTINRNILEYQTGKHINSWPEPINGVVDD